MDLIIQCVLIAARTYATVSWCLAPIDDHPDWQVPEVEPGKMYCIVSAGLVAEVRCSSVLLALVDLRLVESHVLRHSLVLPSVLKIGPSHLLLFILLWKREWESPLLEPGIYFLHPDLL